MTAEALTAAPVQPGDVVSYQGHVTDGELSLGVVSGQPDALTGHIYVNLFEQHGGGCIVVPPCELTVVGPFQSGDYAIYSGPKVEWTSLVMIEGPMSPEGTVVVEVHPTYGGGGAEVPVASLEKLGSVDNWTHEEAQKRLTSYLEWLTSGPVVRYL